MTETISGSTLSVGEQCHYCGCWHTSGGLCPRIEEIEYHRDGTVKRIKLRADQPQVVAPINPYPVYPFPAYPYWFTVTPDTTPNTSGVVYTNNAAPWSYTVGTA